MRVRENRCSENHALLERANENLPIFCILSFKIGTGDVYKHLSCDCEFRENQLSGRHTLIGGVNDFISVISTFVIGVD
jgi:hypothetical protein